MKNIEVFACRFSEKFGIREFPRDPREYLPRFGIAIERSQSHPEAEATWLRTGSIYTIAVSPLMAGPQIALKIYHELFEIMSAHPSFPEILPGPHEEKLATQFAVHLMMPAADVRAQAKALGHPAEDKSAVLANRFGVSLSAMGIRLRELKIAPKRAPRKYY
ncbi:MAG: ImmA/IrrE family metallo-endopeptidase [Armatimonadota bacterium]